jgi:hypothetical protein
MSMTRDRGGILPSHLQFRRHRYNKYPAAKQRVRSSSQYLIMTTTTHPTISTTLSLSPRDYTQGEEPPTLTITLNLSGPAPITIFTYVGPLNTDLALQRRNFTLQDMSTEPPTPINLEVTKGGKRPAFSRRKGSRDAKYYITLYPGLDQTIQCPFFVVRRMEQGTWLPALHIGHRYRLGVSEGEKIKRWWWGTVDDVLIDDEEPDGRVELIGGEMPINICADPVDFEIKEA